MDTNDLPDGPRQARLPMFSRPGAGTMTAAVPPTAVVFDLGPLPPSDSPEMDTDPYDVVPPTRTGRTATSTTGDDDKKPATPREVGLLVAAVLAAVAVGVSAAVRWKTGHRSRLRQPTKTQTEDVGLPLGRIAYRHIPLPKLVPDLSDAIEAAVGINRYLDDGPLTVPTATDSGMPPDLTKEIP